MKNISKQINNMNSRMEFLNSDNNLANNNQEIRPKTINVIFKTIRGKAYNFVFNYGTTIDEILKQYLIKTNSIQLGENFDFIY